jgi:hypothetical protein
MLKQLIISSQNVKIIPNNDVISIENCSIRHNQAGEATRVLSENRHLQVSSEIRFNEISNSGKQQALMFRSVHVTFIQYSAKNNVGFEFSSLKHICLGKI